MFAAGDSEINVTDRVLPTRGEFLLRRQPLRLYPALKLATCTCDAEERLAGHRRYGLIILDAAFEDLDRLAALQLLLHALLEILVDAVE